MIIIGLQKYGFSLNWQTILYIFQSPILLRVFLIPVIIHSIEFRITLYLFQRDREKFMFTLRKIPVSRIWFVLFLIDGTDLTKQFQSLAQYSPTYQIIFALSFKSQLKATFPVKSCTELSFRCRVVDESQVMCLFRTLIISS